MASTDVAPRADLEWPASPWEASAPESYVLLRFQRRPEAKEALKQGILELLARRRLHLVEVERKGLLGRVSKVPVLVHGGRGVWGAPAGSSPSASALGPALAPLWAVFEAHPRRRAPLWGVGPAGEHVEGVEVKDFAAAVVKRFGSAGGYVDGVVRPALVERGWVAAERYRILGIFPARRWVLTPAGTAAQGDLLWRVAYGNRELGRLVDDDPSRAVAFAGLAGAAVLLMDDARPHLQRLRERIDAGAQPPGSAAPWTDGRSAAGDSVADSGAGAGAVDLGAVDAGGVGGALDWGAGGLDLGALDAVDAAVAAVDAGVDAGAADGGGGDGGGGDGGGGSGD